MIIYHQRPTARRARQVWDTATQERGKEPRALWKNPNCWMTPQVVGNAWGWWVAEFDHNDTLLIDPKEVGRCDTKT